LEGYDDLGEFIAVDLEFYPGRILGYFWYYNRAGGGVDVFLPGGA
jgi:hypothetical protein